MTRGGLPHSDIFGSKLVCSSPKLFAACHVLHRLLAPRHSPYTLSSLTIKLKTDAHQSFAYQLVCDSFFRNTACVCGRKKLPCAEYSVVKDQACRALPAICLRRVCLARHRSSAQQTIARRRCARDSTASFAHRNFSKNPASLRRRESAIGLKSAITFQPVHPHSSRRLARQPKLVHLADGPPARCALRWATFAYIQERRLVENTGLEPVTSWLQTRRSPS